jgi:lysophospholipase L1-like esterase
MLAFSLVAAIPAAAETAGTQWISTWATSPQARFAPGFVLPVGIVDQLSDQTVRQVVRVSIGGERVRVRISNEYGTVPLTIGAASIGLAGEAGAVTAGSAKPLTFAGEASVTIPAGAPILSDPVDLKVDALGSLAVSLYFPKTTDVSTMHWDGVQTAYISAKGNFADQDSFEAASTMKSRIFLSDVLVEAGADTSAIVFFGDSITDGACSTPDTSNRWPDLFAARLQAAGKCSVAVINQAISGNRVLSDGMGDSALARLDRDVLRHAGVTTLVVMEGINDIGWPGMVLDQAHEATTADALIAGYRQIIDRAHARGIRVIGATLTPFANAFQGGDFSAYFNPEKEAVRKEVNEWIRTGGAFDGVIDFETALADPAKPDAIRADYDCGDHLHPNDAGYKAMSEAADIELLTAE